MTEFILRLELTVNSSCFEILLKCCDSVFVISAKHFRIVLDQEDIMSAPVIRPKYIRVSSVRVGSVYLRPVQGVIRQLYFGHRERCTSLAVN